MSDLKAQNIEITAIGAEGDGIGEVVGGDGDGKRVFVPFTVAGDKVRVDLTPVGKDAFKGSNMQLVTAGPDRVEARCRHYGKCGGCDLQHLSDDAYSAWIKDRVTMAMGHHGFEGLDIRDAIISPKGSRRRVSLKALNIKGKVQLGFNQQGSHVLVDLQECPVTSPAIMAKLPAFRGILVKLLNSRETAEVQVTETAEGLDVLFKLPRELDLDARMDLGEFAEAHDIGSVRVNIGGFTDPVAERRSPVVRLGKAAVPLPSGAFLQATKHGEQAMVDVVMRETQKAKGNAKKVVDLFCGLGTFTIPMAEQSVVHGVEGAKNMVDALNAGVNFVKGLHQVTTEHRDLFRRPLFKHELNAFDVVVFDPPRAGAKSQVEEIAQSSVQTVIGVSCNPNTFSRDARTLVDAGYTLDYIQPVDQFLWSHHVEIVGVFRRG
jgi:23S rRNA (uracil1939-C5)-methyltransferase